MISANSVSGSRFWDTAYSFPMFWSDGAFRVLSGRWYSAGSSPRSPPLPLCWWLCGRQSSGSLPLPAEHFCQFDRASYPKQSYSHPKQRRIRPSASVHAENSPASWEGFRIIKCQFGYRKTVYRELKKNENRLYAMFACANLYSLAIAGRKLSTTWYRGSLPFFRKSWLKIRGIMAFSSK